ncbi:efflux RND transporter periplasmic adaptor subunit [Alishewanella sp. 16-MA]|uniref:Efflux RND transporter periplasmic adaptor subunit n=1 Tax=Alishewanella maricola TaxID=2795740 RepID=A0ABS8C0J8_9ALTE|nr:efflux RND transporter periplasmic adaptor subunit [Alishewanella maricola]MCB5225851.1 efflux RND transporter periplasmic adaptor subunit [Alishewanella maricola]
MTLFRLIIVSLAIVFFSPAQAQQARGEQATQVIVLPLSFEQQSSRIEAVGTAEAVRSVVIYPAVADKVTAVNFLPGQFVEQGDVLLQLDDRRQQVAVDRATIQLADAERTVNRLQESRQRGAIAQSDLDDAITNRDLLKVQMAEAKTNLEDRTVRAPFSGVVGLTDVEAGDRITLQTPITTLDNREQLLVNFVAPEAALPILSAQGSVSLQPWLSQGETIAAVISQVDSRIDTANRSIRARALLDNAQDQYRPGMSFRVILELKGDSYAVVPEAALLWGATSAYVWLMQDNKAERVDVQIMQRLSGRLLVAGALNAGDMLIVEGVQSLRNGQAVTAVATEGSVL